MVAFVPALPKQGFQLFRDTVYYKGMSHNGVLGLCFGEQYYEVREDIKYCRWLNPKSL